MSAWYEALTQCAQACSIEEGKMRARLMPVNKIYADTSFKLGNKNMWVIC